MALTVYWTLQAEKGLEKVIEYLEKQWTAKEILNLEKKIKRVINQISKNPALYPKSLTHKKLHKAIIDKNNYLIYKVNKQSNSIVIINFRGTKQQSKY